MKLARHLVTAICATLCLGTAAHGHPHVFVDARAGFQFDSDGRLVGLRIVWTYDAFTSLTLFDILDLDRDGDGFLDDEDRRKIVEGETDWPEGYEGDTYLEHQSQKIALGHPTNGAAWMADDRITVAFDLALLSPRAIEDPVELLIYDPTFYYAYEIVGLDGDLSDACAAEIIPFEPDKAAEALQAQLALLSQEETPQEANVGRKFADRVRLGCD